MGKATAQGYTYTDPDLLSRGGKRGERRLCKGWEEEGPQGTPGPQWVPESPISAAGCPCCTTAPRPSPGSHVPAHLAGKQRTHREPDSMSTPGLGETSIPAQPNAKKKWLYAGMADFIPSQSSSHGILSMTLHQYLT